MPHIQTLEGSVLPEFGLRNDRFFHVRPLQQGGQGEVHVCKRANTGDEYAVKVIGKRGLKRRHEARLRSEIRCLRELQHPGIVNLQAAFWQGGCCFIVMDLAREGDLADRINRRSGLGADPLNSDRAAKFVTSQLLAALNFIHQRRVIHRDLKCENILIGQISQAPSPLTCNLYAIKITDFGFSTWLDIDGEPMTPVGTPQYVAPEINSDDYDNRIDYFSVGVIIYIMLCGNFPFHPGNPEEIIESASWDEASENGKSIVRGLLAVDPEKRLVHRCCLFHPWMSEETAVVPSALQAWTDSSAETPSASPGEIAGAIRWLGGWSGNAVDTLTMQWRSGERREWGAEGGWTRAAYDLDPDETIVAVAQEVRAVEPNLLGNAIVFFTSECQVLLFHGGDARRRKRYVAPTGSQIVGLQFQGSRLTGIHLEPMPKNGEGLVKVISGFTGTAVDAITVQLRNGRTRNYGKSGGFAQPPIHLGQNECITIVEQGLHDNYLGNSFAFYTSEGNVYKLVGLESTYSRRFACKSGMQISSLEFDADGYLATVGTCPEHISRPQAHEVESHDVQD